MKTTRFHANRGSNIDFSFVWPNTEGGPLDLTGFQILKMDVDAGLAPYLTVTSPSPGTGVIRVQIAWNSALTKRTYSFRIRLTYEDDNVSTNLVRIVYR